MLHIDEIEGHVSGEMQYKVCLLQPCYTTKHTPFPHIFLAPDALPPRRPYTLLSPQLISRATAVESSLLPFSLLPSAQVSQEECRLRARRPNRSRILPPRQRAKARLLSQSNESAWNPLGRPECSCSLLRSVLPTRMRPLYKSSVESSISHSSSSPLPTLFSPSDYHLHPLCRTCPQRGDTATSNVDGFREQQTPVAKYVLPRVCGSAPVGPLACAER